MWNPFFVDLFLVGLEDPDTRKGLLACIAGRFTIELWNAVFVFFVLFVDVVVVSTLVERAVVVGVVTIPPYF